MKKYSIFTPVAFLVIAFIMIAHADEKIQNSISSQSLNTTPVIGKVGIPLGKVATVLATVVDGDSLRTKSHEGSYLLRIVEVNGTKLDSKPIIEFALAPGSDVKLANGDFALYELKNGEKAESLTSEQIEKLKKGYVGKSFLLQVYELGYFSGIPQNMPKEVRAWQDSGFGFRTYLRILREVDSKRKP